MYRGSFKRGGSWAPRSQYSSIRELNDYKTSPEIENLPLGKNLITIAYGELRNSPGFDPATAVIHSCEYVASYSWVEGKSATIFVPGKPPVWSPPAQLQQLKPDSGDFFRDPNAARFPPYPTEPAVQALLTQNPHIETEDIDLFACGSTLGNLLRFARNIDRVFRFNIEMVGNTLFMVRKESSPTALIGDVRGFGHTFPEAYTTWEADVKKSVSHQRIVKYSFAGMKCILRFESDGYYKELAAYENPVTPKSSRSEATGTDLTQTLHDLTVESHNDLSKYPSVYKNNLQIKQAGEPVPQDAIFDIKTKHGKYPIDMAEIYPRLWVSQIPNFILAYHTRGVFSDIRNQDLRHEVDEWEEANNEALCKLASLIRKLITYAKENRGIKLEIFRKEIGSLEIREQADSGSDTLPPAVKAKWIAQAGQAASTGEEKRQLSIPIPSHTMEAALERPHGDTKSLSYNLEDEDKGDDDDSDPDYTACSAEDCGYCGRCSY